MIADLNADRFEIFQHKPPSSTNKVQIMQYISTYVLINPD
jgi:hypothetical protein